MWHRRDQGWKKKKQPLILLLTNLTWRFYTLAVAPFVLLFESFSDSRACSAGRVSSLLTAADLTLLIIPVPWRAELRLPLPRFSPCSHVTCPTSHAASFDTEETSSKHTHSTACLIRRQITGRAHGRPRSRSAINRRLPDAFSFRRA